ncbi:alpha-galactosidase [Lachnospiraceae bacterium XBB1006]|nr:alpha-galactosidase [Lachnospiraceae bacterium XBB1006]
MIRQFNTAWVLDTVNSTYAFALLPTGQLEHVHYGAPLLVEKEEDLAPLCEKHTFQPGNSVTYDQEHLAYSLEDMRLEMSGFGKGDIREPFVEVVRADGSMTCDFVYEKSEIRERKEPLMGLPSSYGASGGELVITLRDRNYGEILELHYCVFERADVITRYAVLKNTTSTELVVRRLMSAQLDFDDDGWCVHSFGGSWAREMNHHVTMLSGGKFVNASIAGTSSNRANPFVMLGRKQTTEDAGICYGMNLVYSGNHYEAAEVNGYHKTRVVTGINPTQFSYVLKPGEEFTSPEAVLSFSSAGFNGLSQNLHAFVRNHIVRGTWQKKPRPVLLNSWEAMYFDISEAKLLKLAKAGKDVGVELFVMDDGWFGNRENDTKGLGDWVENTKKLPGGVKGLADKIHALGMEFGIWVEPEMVNVDSNLYREHPEWVLQIPDKAHSEGRNQRILDLCNPQVQTYIVESMRRLFSSANISYVKWDMNRIFSDCYSTYVEENGGNQGETAHRYILGFYHVMETLTKEFPHILFEGCASGGNRFDLGMLCYFPQIWGSDNTDAICRARMQTAYSYGYPLSTVGAHVSSCPNHQTLRNTPLATRFNVAAFGVLGYECNLCDARKETLEEIKKQIAFYKTWREVLQFGHFYRGQQGNLRTWTCVSEDTGRAVGLLVQELVEPNTQSHCYYPKGLNPKKRYHFYNEATRYNIKEFGDLVNTVAPIHIKQDSLIHNVVAKFVTMPGEVEDYKATGAALMAGVRVKQAFGGTGYNEETRYFQDFCSRLYLMEEVKE